MGTCLCLVAHDTENDSGGSTAAVTRRFGNRCYESIGSRPGSGVRPSGLTPAEMHCMAGKVKGQSPDALLDLQAEGREHHRNRLPSKITRSAGSDNAPIRLHHQSFTRHINSRPDEW